MRSNLPPTVLLLLVIGFILAACQTTETEPEAANNVAGEDQTDEPSIAATVQPTATKETLSATETSSAVEATAIAATTTAESIEMVSATAAAESTTAEAVATAEAMQEMATAEAIAVELAIPRFPSEGLFEAYSQEPIINLSGENVTKWEMPGAIVLHDDQFHMFVNVFETWPAKVVVHHMTSPDGLDWTSVGDLTFTDDTLQGREGEFYTSYVSSVLVESDGSWVMYYSTVDRLTQWPMAFEGGIGRATAQHPDGPWTADEELILTPGDQDAWDAQGVRDPSVVQNDNGYLMYFTGYGHDPESTEHDARAFGAIGLATSNDGETWTKEAEPILAGSGEERSWDRTTAIAPEVIRTPEGWFMAYTSAMRNECCDYWTPGRISQRKHGLAYSEDGLTWIRSEDPLFVPREAFDESQAWEKAFISYNGVYFLFVQAGPPPE